MTELERVDWVPGQEPLPGAAATMGPRIVSLFSGWHMTTAVKQRTPPAQRTRRRRGPALPPPQIATRKELDAWFEQHSQR